MYCYAAVTIIQKQGVERQVSQSWRAVVLTRHKATMCYSTSSGRYFVLFPDILAWHFQICYGTMTEWGRQSGSHSALYQLPPKPVKHLLFPSKHRTGVQNLLYKMLFSDKHKFIFKHGHFWNLVCKYSGHYSNSSSLGTNKAKKVNKTKIPIFNCLRKAFLLRVLTTKEYRQE